MLRIVSVVGARPNFMKVAPIHRAISAHDDMEHLVVHTGQHYDAIMSDAFFRDLDLPEPARFLGVGSASHAQQTAKILVEFEKACLELAPDLVIVVGDVNSTMAAALVAAKLNIPVAHVEAGLRSFDRTMPEEVNRAATDAVAQWAFVTEASAIANLVGEGWPRERVLFVGNTMIDTLVRALPGALEQARLGELDLKAGEYALVTIHRPSNVDDPAQLAAMVGFLKWLADQMPVVFPLHPRTEKSLRAHGLLHGLQSYEGIRALGPLPYPRFLGLMASARLVVTDSGGIQEETTYLQVPCVTARTSTERPVTCELGTNRLCAPEPAALRAAVGEVLAGGEDGTVPPYWDGRAAERIVRHIDAIVRRAELRVSRP
ncbi:MAG TPA: UDP-N-acetylglucosamine 2-epimerase (non-hydrolyzing) [Polyangiaceae bacterium]|nr:UDP-N-acetylglucosamine 2-epimerase (non-hydrolyzing) [Polyangiaceae bacterium]